MKNTSESKLKNYIGDLWSNGPFKNTKSKLYYIREIFDFFSNKWRDDIEALDTLENNLGMFLAGFLITAEKSKNKKNITKWHKVDKNLSKDNRNDIDARIKTYNNALNKLSLNKLIEFIKIQKVMDTPISGRCAPEIGINDAPVWNNNDTIAKHITADFMDPVSNAIYDAYVQLEQKIKN